MSQYAFLKSALVILLRMKNKAVLIKSVISGDLFGSLSVCLQGKM
jgi:hypothetical protein